MTEEIEQTELQKAQLLVEEDKKQRVKNVGEGIQKLLDENKCKMHIKIGEFTSTQNTPSIDIVISTID